MVHVVTETCDLHKHKKQRTDTNTALNLIRKRDQDFKLKLIGEREKKIEMNGTCADRNL